MRKKLFAKMGNNKLKLHTYPGNKNANKALIVAEYSGIQIDVPRFEMGKSNKTPEFLKLNPFGKVPTLETGDGQGVFESNAIARFVARQSPSAAAQLLGKTPIEQAQVDAWGEFFFFRFFSPFFFFLRQNEKKRKEKEKTHSLFSLSLSLSPQNQNIIKKSTGARARSTPRCSPGTSPSQASGPTPRRRRPPRRPP